MSEVTKRCSSCKKLKPATNEHFHIEARQEDGFNIYCKSCRSTMRTRSVASARRSLARHDKTIEKARAILDNPESSFAVREKAERAIRLAEKHRKPYQDEIDAARSLREEKEQAAPVDDAAEQARMDEEDRLQEIADAEEDRRWEQEQAQKQIDKAAAARALSQIYAKYANHFAAPMSLETRAGLREHFKLMRTNARKYARESEGLDSTGATKSFVATAIAEEFDRQVKRLEVFTYERGAPVPNVEDEFFKSNPCRPDNFVWRTAQEKALLRYATLRFLQAHDYATSHLPDAPEPVWEEQTNAHGSLESLDSYEFYKVGQTIVDLERAERISARLQRIKESDPARYAELENDKIEIIKKSDPEKYAELISLRVARIKENDPKEYERLINLVPNAVEPELIIYRVPTWTHENPYAKARLFWGGGDEVGGNEIVKDPYFGWVRVPGPASNEPDWYGQNEKMEWVFDEMAEGGKWVKRAVGAVITKWEQGPDGHYIPIKTNGPLWDKPEKITFKEGQRQPEGKNHFRYGYWFDDAQIAKFNSHVSEEPPYILPPDKRVKADFIAKAKETPLPEGPIETVWQKHERQQREERERYRN